MTVIVRITEIGAGIARVDWEMPEPGWSDEVLRQHLSDAAEIALQRDGLRRLEVAVPAAERLVRRAVVRSGFRLEGVRRAVVPVDGGLDDLVLYSRLVDDVVGGPDGFSAVMNTVLPRKRLIAHVLIRDDRDRILLCDTRFKIDWELPGGIVESGESPREGATREVREELGLDLDVGRLLVADWLPPYLGWEDALEMIFDGGRVTPADLEAYVLQEHEISAVALLTLDEAARVVTPLSHRRLTVAAGLGPGETAYLEDGRRV